MSDERRSKNFDAENRSTNKCREMALLKRIMHPHLNNAGADAVYMDKLSEWLNVVRECERIFGNELDETVKTATLIE